MSLYLGLALAAAPASAPLPVAAAPSPVQRKVRFEENDPAYAQLNKLMEAADAFSDQADADPAKEKAANEAVIALGLKTKVRGTNLVHPGTGKSLVELGYSAQAAGDNAQAEELGERGLVILRPFRDDYPNNYIQAISLLGYLRGGAGKPAEAAIPLAEGVAFAENRLATRKDIAPVDYMATSNVQYAYADALQRLGQNDRAVEMQRHSLASRVAAFGPDNPDAIASRYGLAMTLFRAGRVAEAEATARDAVDRVVAHVPTTHTSYARALEALALILSRSGRRVEALGLPAPLAGGEAPERWPCIAQLSGRVAESRHDPGPARTL